MFESLCRDGKREEATVRLANSALVKSEGVQVELAFSFSDFSCKERFTVLGMESQYDLIFTHAMVDKTPTMDRVVYTHSC